GPRLAPPPRSPPPRRLASEKPADWTLGPFIWQNPAAVGDDAAFRRLPSAPHQLDAASEDVGVHELAAHLGRDEAVVASLRGDLSRKGLVTELRAAGETRYRVLTQDRRRRGVFSHNWRALE